MKKEICRLVLLTGSLIILRKLKPEKDKADKAETAARYLATEQRGKTQDKKPKLKTKL